MGDIAAGLLIIVSMSLVCFFVGISVQRRCRQLAVNLVGLGIVLMIVLYAVMLHGRLVMARILPVSNVIVFGNVIPLAAAALAGIVVARRSIPLWRRAAVGAILTALAWYTVLCHFAGPRPAVGAPRYDRGVCVQTSRASCSACCAASLLREHAIPASEQEMVELCLTGEYGTPVLGLYRGLKLKTRGTRWHVEVFSSSLRELREANSWPVILLVRLQMPPEGGATWLPFAAWPSGGHHTVVVYGVTDRGEAILADPAEGKTRWPLARLERMWYGEGLRLVELGRDGEGKAV